MFLLLLSWHLDRKGIVALPLGYRAGKATVDLTCSVFSDDEHESGKAERQEHHDARIVAHGRAHE